MAKSNTASGVLYYISDNFPKKYEICLQDNLGFFYLLDYITHHTLISCFQKKKSDGNFLQTTKILNFSFFITAHLCSLWEGNVFRSVCLSVSLLNSISLYSVGEGPM